MDLNGIPLFSLINGRMSWLSARQSVLAENVANGDTPNFVARDLKPVDFQSMLAGQGMGSTQLTTTNARHFEIRASGAAPSKRRMRLAKAVRPRGMSCRSSRK